MCHTKSSTGMATMYARYKFVEKLNEKAGGVPPALNKAALWIGMLSCLGMCFVATFQVGCHEGTNVSSTTSFDSHLAELSINVNSTKNVTAQTSVQLAY